MPTTDRIALLLSDVNNKVHPGDFSRPWRSSVRDPHLLAIDIYRASILHWLQVAVLLDRLGEEEECTAVGLLRAAENRTFQRGWVERFAHETEGTPHGEATDSYGQRLQFSYCDFKSVCSDRAPGARKSRRNRCTCPRALASQRLSARITRRRLVPGEARTGGAIRFPESGVRRGQRADSRATVRFRSCLNRKPQTQTNKGHLPGPGRSGGGIVPASAPTLFHLIEEETSVMKKACGSAANHMGVVTLLSVGPIEEDHDSLEGILMRMEGERVPDAGLGVDGVAEAPSSGRRV